jgi:hypothetical protein
VLAGLTGSGAGGTVAGAQPIIDKALKILKTKQKRMILRTTKKPQG